MEQSLHYHLKLVEGTDTVNPLLIDKPNYEDIDDIMFANECASVGTATEITTNNVHALTRAKDTQNVFKFRATSNYIVGDTFTVDGDVVSAQFSDGSTLSDRCYIIGSEVLCSLNNGQLTLYIAKIYDATNVMNGTKSVKENIDDIDNAITAINTKLNGMKFNKFVQIDPTANETWASVLGRMRDAISDNYANIAQFCNLVATVDGVTGMIFTPSRIYSSALVEYWYSVKPTNTGLVVYVITMSATGATLAKNSISTTNGTMSRTDLSDTVGATISFSGADFNR